MKRPLARSLDTRIIRSSVLTCVTVLDTPCWDFSDPNKDCATGDFVQQYLPIDPQQYATFIGALMDRYPDDIHAWEVWNEPKWIPK